MKKFVLDVVDALIGVIFVILLILILVVSFKALSIDPIRGILFLIGGILSLFIGFYLLFCIMDIRETLHQIALNTRNDNNKGISQ